MGVSIVDGMSGHMRMPYGISGNAVAAVNLVARDTYLFDPPLSAVGVVLCQKDVLSSRAAGSTYAL